MRFVPTGSRDPCNSLLSGHSRFSRGERSLLPPQLVRDVYVATLVHPLSNNQRLRVKSPTVDSPPHPRPIFG